MRIAVFGTGGVGGYFGGRLAQAGEDVVFIARGEHLRAMQEHGLRVDSIAGDFVVAPVQATDDPGAVGGVDVVLLGVKAWQVPAAARAVRPMLGPGAFVVPLQNGVEAPAQLSTELGGERVLGGLCGLISFLAGPGNIRHTGFHPFIKFGELDNRPSDRIERLHAAFVRAEGLTAEVPADIEAAMWEKFLLIAAWSGLGAVTRTAVGVFRSQPETRWMLRQVMEEIYAVARARDVALPPDIVDRTVRVFDGVVAEGTASMQRDIIAGRPSELEAQTGAVVRLGRETGVKTPINEYIYNSLLPMERLARGQI